MVIYFTGTGNSRYIAELIAVSLGDKVVGANTYIKEGRKGEFSSEKPYVFVCPTYAWQIPQVFKEFIKSGEFCGDKRAYFILTCGDAIGGASAYNERLCAEKNMKYMGLFKVEMPENYIAMYNTPNTEVAERIISAAEKMIPQISDYISKGIEFPYRGGGIVGGLLSGVVNSVFYAFAVKSDGFRTTDKCISCGVCVKLCPLNNIKLENGKPFYGSRCTHCMACICGCPTEAIEYNNKSVGQPRYYLRKSAL